MKICFVAPANNYHTKKWCKWFVEQSHEVHVISFIEGKIDGVAVHWLESSVSVHSSDVKKLLYFFKMAKLKKIIDKIRPDIISVHYATSYGAVVALSGIRNYALSVWGADIYDFPRKSWFHRKLLAFSLSRAEYLLSTSVAMADEVSIYTDRKIEITPFGVDMELFVPYKNTRTNANCMKSSAREFVVGTVKSLSPKYGIDIILEAVAMIRKEHPEIPIRVRIAGTGSHEMEYKKLSVDLKLEDCVDWLGFISQAEAAREWACMDVALLPSTLESESFGVSAVEAQACGIPVIISDIPGLMEATCPGETSMVIPRKNVKALASAIIWMYEHPKKRLIMGCKGRNFVGNKYELNNCFRKIEQLFYQYANR